MSSILKALKKIEGRKVDTSLPAWPYGTGSPESMDSHIRRSRRHQKILGLLIILCAVALTTKIYVGSRSKSEKTGLEKTASQSMPPVAAPSEKTIEIEMSQAQKAIAVAPQSTPAPETPPRDVSRETTPPRVIAPTPVEKPSTEIAPPAVSSETAAAEQAPAPTITETFGAPPDDNAGLSLMALVWSQRPESRFVVINGTIVREGGSIGDSIVDRIEEDYAVMRTGGVKWKLK